MDFFKRVVHIIGVISCFLVMLKTSRATAIERTEISMPGSGVDKKSVKEEG